MLVATQEPVHPSRHGPATSRASADRSILAHSPISMGAYFCSERGDSYKVTRYLFGASTSIGVYAERRSLKVTSGISRDGQYRVQSAHAALESVWGSNHGPEAMP